MFKIGLFILIILAAVPALTQTSPKRVGEIDVSERNKFSERYSTKNSSMIGIGPGFATNLGTDALIYSFQLGYDWEAGSQAAVTFSSLIGLGAGSSYVDALIGGKYFFSDLDTSPFIQAGFGLGASKGVDLKAASGFALGLTGGVVFLRTSAVHLEVFAAYHTLLAKNEKGSPGLGQVGLRLLF